MRIELTEQSGFEVNNLAAADMTPAMAARYLEGKIHIRGFEEFLRQLYPGRDLKERLIFALTEQGGVKDSAAKRVRNWLQGKNLPADREDLFRIAFAPGFDEVQTSALLGFCTDYGIHYRSGRELTYAYCLRRGLTYCEAAALYASLPDPAGGAAASRMVTHRIVSVFHDVKEDEAFIRLYGEYLDFFSELHERSYEYFERYFGLLVSPEGTKENYSVQEAMEIYFSLHMPAGSRRSQYSVVQKMLKQGWPNATSLKNIRARREDVPRKLLLLLYIVTENVVDGDYDEIDEDYLSKEELFEEHWWRVNLMLKDCGMPTLDPRNAYDWLVLYSLNDVDGESAMSERMEAVIAAMFGNIFEQEGD